MIWGSHRGSLKCWTASISSKRSKKSVEAETLYPVSSFSWIPDLGTLHFIAAPEFHKPLSSLESRASIIPSSQYIPIRLYEVHCWVDL